MSECAAGGLPWVEKYRPKGLDELVGHEDVVRTIERLVATGSMPHMLLYGPPGTGKTSTILAAAHKLYGDGYAAMVLELNASDERGIDVVRNQIKDFASSKKLFSSGLKLVVLDEADAMTNAAQSALRRSLFLLVVSSSPQQRHIHSTHKQSKGQSLSNTREGRGSASSATTSTRLCRPSSRGARASASGRSSQRRCGSALRV